jgi:3-dehydroquinate synthase
VLNFGHTVGHAIEATSGYALLHGEAVAIGMALEARIAERTGTAEAGTAARVAALLERFGLPLEAPQGATVDDVLAAMGRDKKVRAGGIRLALPRRVGEMHGDSQIGWTVPVSEDLLREILGSAPATL